VSTSTGAFDIFPTSFHVFGIGAPIGWSVSDGANHAMVVERVEERSTRIRAVVLDRGLLQLLDEFSTLLSGKLSGAFENVVKWLCRQGRNFLSRE
jgi:hypothetical protein